MKQGFQGVGHGWTKAHRREARAYLRSQEGSQERGPLREPKRFTTEAAPRPRHERVTKGKVLERLWEANYAVERAEKRRERRVGEAREFGLTWAEIGRGLGVTGQAAGKRYGGANKRRRTGVVGQ